MRHGSPTLILVPTELERGALEALGGFPLGSGLLELAGFGPLAAAARTAELCARLAPRRVLLLGIAGSFENGRAPLASAALFAHVTLEGVGAGAGPVTCPPSRLGFPQWPGEPLAPGTAIDERLELAGAGTGELLTVCAASSSPGEAAERRRRHPGALGEDMEGFGVALACSMAQIPLAVVRGFSNTVGERDHARWDVRAALGAARARALELLAREEWPSS